MAGVDIAECGRGSPATVRYAISGADYRHMPKDIKTQRSHFMLELLRHSVGQNHQPDYRRVARIIKANNFYAPTTQVCDIECALSRTWRRREKVEAAWKKLKISDYSI